VLMASAMVVLKHVTSTLRQRHTLISIDFKFGVGDHVREVTNPDNDRSRRHVEVTYTGTVFFIIFFNRATAHTREPIFGHNSSKKAVWCKKDPFCKEKCVILKFGGVLP